MKMIAEAGLYPALETAGDMLVRRLGAVADLTAGEVQALHRLSGDFIAVKALQDVRMEGDENPGLYFLSSGWITSSICLANGKRQVVAVHVDGDLMGASSLPFLHAVDTLTPLTDCLISQIPAAQLGAIFAEQPRLGGFFFLAAQRKRVALMDNLLMLGRLSARQGFAAFLLTLFDRKAGSPEAGRQSIYIPMNQDQFSDVLGISAMHVSRTIKSLEVDGYITRTGRTFHFVDLPRLRKFAKMPERSIDRRLSWLPHPDASRA